MKNKGSSSGSWSLPRFHHANCAQKCTKYLARVISSNLHHKGAMKENGGSMISSVAPVLDRLNSILAEYTGSYLTLDFIGYTAGRAQLLTLWSNNQNAGFPSPATCLSVKTSWHDY